MSENVEELIGGVMELRGRMYDQGRRGGEEQHRKVAGSPAPWNAPPADLLLDVHAGARRLEAGLAAALGRRPAPLGSTDAGTAKALRSVVGHVRIADDWLDREDYPMLSRAAFRAEREVGLWGYRFRSILDRLRPEEQPWTRAPGGLRCPNPLRPEAAASPLCDRDLWLAPGWQHEHLPPVYCLRCTDRDGEPYAWPHAAWLAVVSGA